MSLGNLNDGRGHRRIPLANGIDGVLISGKHSVLVSLREIGMEQPVKQIRRGLLKCLRQLPIGAVSLGQVHLRVLAMSLAVHQARPGSGNAQAEDEAHDDDEQRPPKVNHLVALGLGLQRKWRIVPVSSLLLSLGALE